MNNVNPFLAALRSVLVSHGLPETLSPAGMIDEWQSFVEQCEEGYRWDMTEYDNDISVRRRLELLLTAPELRAFDESVELAACVREIDNRFGVILLPGAPLAAHSPFWWEQSIPKYAGEEFARDSQALLGLTVEVKK